MFRIYFKEMIDSFRDRRTLVLTVLLPVIMMTGLTLFYENMISGDEKETYTLAVETDITPEEEGILSNHENIEIIKVSDVEEALNDGEALAAIQFTPDFVEKIESGEEASITILGDSFSENSASLMALVENVFAVYEKAVINDRLQQKGIDLTTIEPFSVEIKELSSEDAGLSLLAMLIPLMLVLAIGIGAGPSASDLFAGEKEKKTMEALLMSPIKRSTLVMAKWLAVSTIGAITGIVTLVVVFLQIAFFTENLKNAVSLGENTYLIIGLGALATIIYAMFIASLQIVTSIVAKTVKESQSYSTPVMMLPMFPLMFVMSIGVTELGFQHFVIPFMNLFSLLKELLFGVVNYEHILLTFGSNILYMIVFFIIGRILFMKDKWVMN